MDPALFIDDPGWARIFAEFREGARTRHVPSHEDCSPLDIESAARHLQRGGTFGLMPGYEERPGQIDMLRAIAHAFNAREHLMIEAGTGVGKSLAYLVPAILWSAVNDTPVLVSTATRNLQSQLIGADIPRALGVLDEATRAKFRVALLKGRGNYLCIRALSEFFAPGFWTMSPEEQAEMPHLIEWLRKTPDGDLDTYEGLPRSLLTCPGEECAVRRCPYYSRCFVYRARRNAAEANLVVANHSLVMAEAGSDGGGVLPPYGWLILDEAHNLETIATEFLSAEFSLPALTRVLNRLMRRGKGRRAAHAGGVLAAIERQLQKGVLAGAPTAEQVRTLLARAPSLIVRAVNAAEALADVAARLLRPAGDRPTCRYRTTAGGEPVGGEGAFPVRMFSLHGLFKPYPADAWDESVFLAAQGDFESALAGLVNLLHELCDALVGATPPGELPLCGDLVAQAGGVAESLVAFANEASFVFKGERDTHAYWVERVRQEKRPSYIRLVAAPLSVACDLKRMFYERKESVILSSATLRVGNDFRYMARRLGCGLIDVRGPEASEGRFRALTAASPFDYLRQALVLAADCLPDPAAEPGKYAVALGGLLGGLFEETGGRGLVLFTSYELMNAVAAEARSELAERGIELLVQGEGLSRETMTKALKRAGRTVLFGAQSFWEGVDVAGEALSCVVVAKLPFAQIGDPVVEARGEKIDRDGGSSFRDYLLPEAVIRFRQGFGRLIRTRADRGVVVVADSRIVTKGYGAVFRRSVPATVHTVTDTQDLLARVADFFE